MEGPQHTTDHWIRQAAKALTGYRRRLFIADVTLALCDGNPRASGARFGGGRQAASQGLRERASGSRCVEIFQARRCPTWEERQPQLAADIRAIVEPRTHADPE